MEREATYPIKLVAGVLRRDNSVLFGKRSNQVVWYKGLWDLPGGHVEANESEEDAVVRELLEETGVCVLSVDPTPIERLHDCDADGQVLATLSVWMIAEWTGTPRIMEPIFNDRMEWISAEELCKISLAHPEYVRLLSSRLH